MREKIILNCLDKQKRSIHNISKISGLSYDHTKSSLKILSILKMCIEENMGKRKYYHIDFPKKCSLINEYEINATLEAGHPAEQFCLFKKMGVIKNLDQFKAMISSYNTDTTK